MEKLQSLWDFYPLRSGRSHRSVFLRLLLLVCMLTTASSGWAAQATWSSANQSSLPTSLDDGNITLDWSTDGNTNNTVLYGTGNSKVVRFFSDGNKIVIGSTSDYKITSIVITISNKSNSPAGFTTLSSGTWSTFNTSGQNTFTVTTPTAGETYEISIYKSGGTLTNGRIDISGITVNYEAVGGGSDTTAPTLSSSTPGNGATGIATSGNIVLTFSENVTIVDASKFTLSNGTLNTTGASVSGATVTIPYSGLSNGANYTFSAAAGAVKDAAENTNAAQIDISFTTVAAEESLTAVGTGTFFNISNWTEGNITSTTKYATDGSTSGSPKTIEFVANSSNGVQVATNSSQTIDDETFTKRLKLNGTGNSAYRYIHFKVSGPCTIYAYAYSGNSSRKLKICQGSFDGTDLLGGNGTCTNYTKLEANYTDSGESDIYIYSSSSNISVYGIKVVASAETFTITNNASTNGTYTTKVNNNEVSSATSGATVTVTATPADGYKLDAVTVTGATSGDNITTSGTGNSRTFTMPAENVYVTATFVALPTNSVSITTPSHGELSSDKTTDVQEGATVTITATPEAGYRFASLSVVDGSSNSITVNGSGNTRTFTMPATAVTVTGNFVALPTITTSATNGTVTTSPASYAAEGTTVTITATPATNYSLSDITVKDASNNVIAVTDNQFTMPSTNVTVTATFVAQQISADERWNFTTMSSEDEAKYKADATNWATSSGYFSNKFTATSNTVSTYSGGDIVQIQGLKYIRSGSGLSSNNIVIYKPTSSADGYMKFNGGSGRGVVIPGSELTTGMQVNVEYEGGSASNGFTLTNAMDAATSGSDVTTITSATRTTATFYVKAGGSDIQMIANNSNIKLYKITLGSSASVDVAEPTFSIADGTGQTTGTVDVTVTTNQTTGTTTTYYGFGTNDMTRDELVSGNKTTDGSSTVSPTATSENDIVISAVTKAVIDGNTYYSEVVTATYPFTGKRSFSVSAPNLTIQQGDRQVILPVISYPDGTAFDPADDENNPTLQNLTDYFDFTFQKTTSVSEYVTVDGSTTAAGTTGEVNTKVDDNEAPTGTVETITITATKKSDFSGTWPFKNDGPVSTTITATVIAKAAALYMSFYWDPDFTVPVTSADYTQNGSVSVFNGVIPNGRMIYVKPAEGYTVYAAAGSASETVSKVSGNSKKNGVCHYQYRNGCALQFEDSEFGDETEKEFYLNLATYNSSGVAEGSNVQSVFTLSNDNSYRPANLTYDPADTSEKLSTAVTVAAIGTEGSYIFSKFSSKKTTYQTPNLINEDGIQVGVTSVGVFSTEVAERKITGLQVSKNATDNYWYIGKQSGQTYTYTFATELTLKSNTHYTNVYTGTGTAETIDLSELIKSITYYNKSSKADIDITNEATKSGEQATQIETVTYDIEFRNGAGGEGVTDGTTLAGDVVTIGKKSGVAIVTITYPGGDYEKTVNSRTGVTAPAKATYTIYITDPNEQLPNITPTTRSFVDEQAVRIQAPSTWDVLYMVVEPGSTNYDATTATYVSEGDGKNCTLLKAGEFVMLTITETSKVRAFAFDSNATTFTPGVSGTTSKEVYETYTKLDPLKAPLLNPYGEPHTRTTATLKVTMAAQDAVAGLEGYYTTDGTDPTPTTGERYNGAEGINISGASTTVKAIVYDPATGRISPVTTGVYLYTANIDKPIFYVSNDNGSTWDGGHSEGTVNVTGTSWIKITGPTDSQIYYTLDGSTPTPGTSREFTTGEHFIIVKNNTTGKAIAIQNDATSPVTTVVFNLTDESQNLWEATSETTPSGKMAADDRYVVYGKSTSNSSKKAVKYLTATFGGMDATGWSHADISENTKGTPLDGVGSYSIRNIKDAWDESGKEPQNSSSLLHERTFKLPAQGDMVRFEPERDGRLTIWLLQQGGLNYTDDGEFCDAFIRLRPVYMLDEQGNAVEVSTTDGIKSSTRLSSNWDELKTGAWTPKGSTQNGVTNIYYDNTQSTNIYNMYSDYLTTHEIGAGDAIEPFALTDATVKGYTGIDGTGYVMPSGGYVRYTFDVKGGKSYYLYGFRTKLGVRGFRFQPTSETVAKSVTVADNTADIVATIKAGGTDGPIAADEICNVTYTRKFTNGKWAGVVFPFSVSFAQMKKVFGDLVDVVHLESVNNDNINLKRHWYPMIVAGTPVLIKPSKDMGASVTFEGVRIEAESVTELAPAGSTYKMTGTFTPSSIGHGCYYVSGGALSYRSASTAANTNACRSWLTPVDGQARPELRLFTADAFGADEWNVAGNPQPFVQKEDVVTYINGVEEDGIIQTNKPANVYTISGQLVRQNSTSLEGLPKGIYIVNGKKVAVK